MRHRLPADVLLLITVLIWSFHFAVIKYALTHGFEPLAYATARFGVGSLVFAAITYGHEGTLRMRTRDLPLLFGAVAVCLYLNQVSFAYGVERTNAATIALLFGTMPVLVGVASLLLRTEQAQRRYWLAAAVSFGGVALVAAEAEGGLSGDLGGVLIGLGAPLSWAIYSVLAVGFLRRYSPYRFSAVVGLAASLPLVLTALPQLSGQDWGAISTLAWGALLYSMLLSFVVTNVLWFTAIERVGANRAALYSNLQPFLGAAFAVVALGERMGPLAIAGGVVIAAGIVIARPRRTQMGVVD